MNENHKDIQTLEAARSESESRQVWSKPELKTICAREAETLLVGSNADIVFS